MFIYRVNEEFIIKYDSLKSMDKALTNKKSQLKARIIHLIIRGWTDGAICVEVGLNYHLYRYYLTNINKGLRIQLSHARRYRRTYKKEQELRKIKRRL